MSPVWQGVSSQTDGRGLGFVYIRRPRGAQQESPAGIRLDWQPNTEADLSHYNVYRNYGSDFETGPVPEAPIDEETRERLEALGYVD